MFPFRNDRPAPPLIWFDAGDLHRFGPQFDVSRNHRSEFLRAAANRLSAAVVQLLGEFGVLDGAHDFRCKLMDDLLRSSRWRHQAAPGGRLESWESGFADRWDVGSIWRTLITCHCQQPDSASFSVR